MFLVFCIFLARPSDCSLFKQFVCADSCPIDISSCKLLLRYYNFNILRIKNGKNLVFWMKAQAVNLIISY